MPLYVGLDVSQKTTAICAVDERGDRRRRGVCATDPQAIAGRILQHAGADAKVGVETGAMTPWLVHGLRGAGISVACLDARRVKSALQMRLNKMVCPGGRREPRPMRQMPRARRISQHFCGLHVSLRATA